MVGNAAADRYHEGGVLLMLRLRHFVRMDCPIALVALVGCGDLRRASAIADDPCQGQNGDPQVPRRMVPSHYHEGLSLGADVGATATGYAVRLLGDEDTVQANVACQRVLGTP
jgi:hypothetical protein